MAAPAAPTDPAGAMIDETTFAKMRALGLDPAAYLDNNDATAFFAATGDLLLTGPTLTNVNDIRVILVDVRCDAPSSHDASSYPATLQYAERHRIEPGLDRRRRTMTRMDY